MSHAKPDKAFRCPQYTNSVLVWQSSAPPRDWVSAAAAANQNTQVTNKLKQPMSEMVLQRFSEQWDIQHKVRSNASDPASCHRDEERQIHRTEENRPDRDEQDISDASSKTGVRKIVMGVVFGGYPGRYTHLQRVCVRKRREYEIYIYTSMIANTTIAPNMTSSHCDSKPEQKGKVVITHWGDLYAEQHP